VKEWEATGLYPSQTVRTSHNPNEGCNTSLWHQTSRSVTRVDIFEEDGYLSQKTLSSFKIALSCLYFSISSSFAMLAGLTETCLKYKKSWVWLSVVHVLLRTLKAELAEYAFMICEHPFISIPNISTNVSSVIFINSERSSSHYRFAFLPASQCRTDRYRYRTWWWAEWCLTPSKGEWANSHIW